MITTEIRVEQWERGWRAYCPDCLWDTKDMPFPDPDAALHALALHRAIWRVSR
jgi:hypothetical protein